MQGNRINRRITEQIAQLGLPQSLRSIGIQLARKLGGMSTMLGDAKGRMMVYSEKETGPNTTVWRNTASGTALVKTFRGLPYGTAPTAFIEGFGEAILSGTRKSGSGNNETIVEAMYTLK